MGWGGASLILGAYLLLAVGKLDARSPVYHALNIFGAAGFIINSFWHGAVPSGALNVVWMLIGVAGLWRVLSQRASAPTA